MDYKASIFAKVCKIKTNPPHESKDKIIKTRNPKDRK